MWTLVASLLSWLLGLFGFGKSKSDVQAAQAQGEKQGEAEEGKATDDKIIQDVAAANSARQSERDAPASELRSDDGFRRD